MRVVIALLATMLGTATTQQRQKDPFLEDATAPEARVLRKRRSVSLVVAAAVVTAVAVVAAGFLVARSGAEGPDGNSSPAQFSAGSDATQAQIANRGLIPREAVDWNVVELERLVNQGLIPPQALDPAPTSSARLFTDRELTTIRLAEQGLIPASAVDWRSVELKRLANRGLIPRAAATP